MNKGENNNFYKILEIDRDAILSDDSKNLESEIRKSYRKLVLKYHPDKNLDNPDCTQKFRDVQMAYEVLSDKDRREDYDNLNKLDKIKLYDSIKKYLANISPEYINILDSLINTYYGDESEFSKDFDTFNFKNIYDKIIKNFDKPDFLKYDLTIPIYQRQNNNIYGKINTTLLNRFKNKFKKIIVHRNDNTTKEYYIPLVNNDIIIKNEGNLDENNIRGDIIIKIICSTHEKFEQIGDSDLFLIINISKNSYLEQKGKNYTLIHIDDSTLNFVLDSKNDKLPIYCIKNKVISHKL